MNEALPFVDAADVDAEASSSSGARVVEHPVYSLADHVNHGAS